jgi:hypothetical protein
MIGLPLGRGALMGAPMLGLQALAAAGGFVLCVVYLASGGDRAPAWGAFVLGVIGLAALAQGAARIISEDRPITTGSPAAEEVTGFLAGLQVVLLPLAVLFALAMALHIDTVT